jgi:hypothetical protein
MSLLDSPHLRLAGVTRLALSGPRRRGPQDAFLFDPHRLALPCWALAVGEAGPPAMLVTLDRHFDLVRPERPEAVPDLAAGLRALDEHVRWELDVRNYDHILAAMEAGVVGDALFIARARPRGSLEAGEYVDRRGGRHRLLVASTVDRVSEGFGTPAASPLSREVEALLARAGRVLLDVDLDCFTSPSDADPTEVLPWPRTAIRSFLLPEGSGAFWDAVLGPALCLTLAREPHHCGGLLATGRLLEEALGVLFGELLGAELP